MSLKPVVDTLDGVPEGLRSFYEERDGKFVLPIDGMVPRDKLEEFRSNNVRLMRELDETRAKFDGIDPEEARKLADRAAKERDRKLIDAGKVDDLVAERVGAMKTELTRALEAERAEKAKITAQLEGHVIDAAVRDAATKSGVRATAVDDVLLRARTTFRMVDGKAVAMDGDKVIFGKAGDPMPIDEWMAGLTQRAPHLFEDSKGGGARQANAGGGMGAGRVARGDSVGVLKNLADIAAGKVQVV